MVMVRVSDRMMVRVRVRVRVRVMGKDGSEPQPVLTADDTAGHGAYLSGFRVQG